MAASESSVGIFTTDADLIVRSWDKWLERVTDIGAEEVCGKPLVEVFPEVEKRGLLKQFRDVLDQGTVAVLAPAFHRYLLPARPKAPSRYFDRMQQRVTIAPLRGDDRTVGTIVTIEDVTARLERERDLAAQLSSPDERVRLRAVSALAQGEGEESVRPLVSVLGDESWRVRGEAVKGLAGQGGPEAVGELLKALRHEHRNLSVLNSALQVLSIVDLDVLTPLVEFLGDTDTELRTYSALALGEMGDRRATSPLISSAMGDEDVNVRYHAIEALGKLKATEAVEALCDIAGSGDFFLAFSALDALLRIGDPSMAPRIVPLLDDDALREPAARALGRLGDRDAVQPLAALINSADLPADTVAVAAESLADLHDRYERFYEEGSHIADLARTSIDGRGAANVVAALDEVDEKGLRPLALVLGWLEGPEVEMALVRLLSLPTARREVVETLVRHGDRVFDALIHCLRSEDGETRGAAATVLGRIGAPRAVPELIDLMQRDESQVISVAGALAKIGDREAFEALVDLLGHSSTAVRQAAISALNSIGHPDMARRVSAMLEDPDPLLRESAVRIAGYFGYPECADLLFERCHDEIEAVRGSAVESIVYLDDERVVPLLCETVRNDTPRVRAAAARALSLAERHDALPCLSTALEDDDPWVRYFSARSIERLDAGEIEGADRDRLFETLSRMVRSDEAHQVRIAAMAALSTVGGRDAVEILTSQVRAEDRDVTRSALCALGRIPGYDSLAPILAVLRSGDPSLRLDAIQALKECRESDAVGALAWATMDKSPDVVRAAMEGLVHLGSREAVSALIGMTADQARREVAVDTLSRMGADGVDFVADGLSHPDPGVRSSVVDVLARMKHQRATERLVDALHDSEASVRLAAIHSLKQLGSRQAEALLSEIAHSDPDVAVRHAAKGALRHNGF